MASIDVRPDGVSVPRAAHPFRPLLGVARPADGGPRGTDVAVLRSALATLADDDRQLLFERYVHARAVGDIADDLGVGLNAVTGRVRRAEERLTAALAAAHARDARAPECRAARATMLDHLEGRLRQRRRRHVDDHLRGCPACTQAFSGIREAPRLLLDHGQHLIGGWNTVGALTGAPAIAGPSPGARPTARRATIAAGVVVALATGAAAVLLDREQTPAAPQTPQADQAVAAAPPASAPTVPEGTQPVEVPPGVGPSPGAAPSPGSRPAAALGEALAAEALGEALAAEAARGPAPEASTGRTWAVTLSATSPAALAVYQVVPTQGATITSVTTTSPEDHVVSGRDTGRWYVIAFPCKERQPGDRWTADASVRVVLAGPAGASVQLVQSSPSAVGGLSDGDRGQDRDDRDERQGDRDGRRDRSER